MTTTFSPDLAGVTDLSFAQFRNFNVTIDKYCTSYSIGIAQTQDCITMDKYIQDTEVANAPPENKLQDRIIKITILIVMIAFGAGLIWLFLKPHYLSEILLWVKDQGNIFASFTITSYGQEIYLMALGYWGNVIIGLSFVLIAFPFAFTGYTILALASGFLYGFIAGTHSLSLNIRRNYLFCWSKCFGHNLQFLALFYTCESLG